MEAGKSTINRTSTAQKLIGTFPCHAYENGNPNSGFSAHVSKDDFLPENMVYRQKKYIMNPFTEPFLNVREVVK
ncbi:MAG: hypothetical protein PUG74_12005 [Prevotellaceae bacterium]|nr:hypothetical protein [Prevotellaceae bacterium]